MEKLERVKKEDAGTVRLEYARPSRHGRFNARRAAIILLAICLPPLACFAWAWFGTEWLVAQPWFRSGNPMEAKYRPIYIERPFWICTGLICVEVLIVLAKVLGRRWRPQWLLILPFMVGVWITFVIEMFILSDRVFP
jgi:hypothetical protein